MRRFLIDTDTASDDAVALIMAVKAPDVHVEAITVVAGNVPLPQAVQNALYTLELCESDVPVYAGRDKPLLRPLETAQFVHGQDGMGDLGLPLHGRQAAKGHAVDVLIDAITRHAGDITLVTLGPLTNVAAALLREPSLAHKVPRCVTMGGAGDSVGNITPVSEYNFWADPEAAKIVLESGMPITMVGWDISRKYATFDHEASARLRAVGTPLAEFAVDIQRKVDTIAVVHHLEGYDLPDPIAMAAALDPSVVTTTRVHVAIETVGTLCRGQSAVDHFGLLNQPPNVDLALTADREAFLQMLHAAVGAR